MPNRTQSQRYMDKLVFAMHQHLNNTFMATGKTDGALYSGKKGAIRLAREFGKGLFDSPEGERESAIQESYIYLCVRAYGLEPPIDADEWIGAIRESMNELVTSTE
jgi:hypothetical protein